MENGEQIVGGLHSPSTNQLHGVLAQSGRALHLQCSGQEFKSLRLHPWWSRTNSTTQYEHAEASSDRSVLLIGQSSIWDDYPCKQMLEKDI